MGQVNLGRLKEMKDLRAVWSKEALDFTPWLSQEDNLALLADAVGLDISVEETEAPVGDFYVDIFAFETGTGRKIIIENQLEDTNHDHLGKLITYASGKSADVIIWVVKRAREEHRAAIEWLNNHTDENIGFFLCEIKLYRIGDSAPAVKFEVIEKPNDWTKEVRKNEFSSESKQRRFDYWAAFQSYAFNSNEFSKEFKKRKLSTYPWMDYFIGSSECNISVNQIWSKSKINVVFYIPDNKDLYQSLLEHRETIEADAGISFSWDELPEHKASKVLIERSAELENRDSWNEQFDWIIDVMLKMKRAFKPHI